MSEIAAVFGLLSALVGLLAAYVSRKKEIKYVVEVNNSGRTRKNTPPTFKKKWYDYYLIIAFFLIIFFPIGFYALYQSRTVSPFWKWFWFLSFAFLVALVIS